MNSIFKDTINQHNMLFKGCKIFVALSGGVDSVVLLFMLKQLQNEYDLVLEALHVNHCIRGIDADNDETFCVNLCKSLNIDISVYKIDVPQLAKQKKIGIEECARNVRYEYFYKMLDEKNFDVIATAHNLNDNAETVLFNLIRGSGIKGLCGIPPIRDKIVRPLINCSKQQIIDFAQKNNLSFVFDKTNDDTKYTRNYIRHEIIPKVMDINPSFLHACQRTCKLLSIDDDYITMQADLIFKDAYINDNEIIYNKSQLSNLDDAVLSRLIILSYEKFKKDQLSFVNINNALKAIKSSDKNKIIELPNNIIIEFLYDKIIFKRHLKITVQDFYCELTGVNGDINFEQLGITIAYKIDDCNNQLTKKDGIVNINYDIIKGNIFFRNRKVNDGFIPLGGTGTKSVKKMLIDKKIPKDVRDFLPVLCCDDEVIWVMGLDRINDKFKPGKDTKKILRLFIKKGDLFFESGY